MLRNNFQVQYDTLLAVATVDGDRCERECRVNNKHDSFWRKPDDGEKILERCHNAV